MGTYTEMSAGESCVATLRCLKSYHERVFIPIQANRNQCKEEMCPALCLGDHYAQVLEEAIRCVKIVHGLQDDGAENI